MKLNLPVSVLVRKYFLLVLGSFLAAVGLEFFLVPNNVIDGGIVGVALMVDTLSDWNFGVIFTLLNLPFVYLGARQIGWRFALATGFSVCCLSLWTTWLEPIGHAHAITDDIFLATVFGGIIDGLGVGLIIKNGGSLDGTEIVGIIGDKKSSFSVGEIVMFINIFILGTAGFLFGWDRAMYSLIAYFVIAKVIDVVIKGLDETYAVTIVSTVPDEVKQALMGIGRGVTVFHGEGGFSGAELRVLLVVVTRLELTKLKELVQSIDPHAFITIETVTDIIGGRFNKAEH